MNLNSNVSYLRACLREAVVELNERNAAPKGTREIFRDSRLCEAVALLLDRVELLEKGGA